MSRLFISHSSADSIEAIAFRQWLRANDWPPEEIFLDHDDIHAGEDWKDALRKAHTRCEAVILLASPDALASPECLAEVRKAEDFGKEIIVVLLRDLKVDDRRLDSLKNRQIVDLSVQPQAHEEIVTYRGNQQTVHFNGEQLGKIKSYLVKRGLSPDHFPWPPLDSPNANPFPGLRAFTGDDAGIFFGRDADILRGLDRLRIVRRDGRPRLLVIQAASGAGKSSYLRAGLWPRLNRDPDFAPIAVLRPAQGILTGPEGLGRKLAALLSRPGKSVSPGEIHAQLTAPDAGQAVASFNKLIAAAAAQALERRRIGDSAARPPALIFAVDQAEELFGTDDTAESERFLVLLASLIRDPPPSIEPFCLFTIRADGAARLFQTIADLNLEAPETLPLLPLPSSSYRDVIVKPLDLLARRGQRVALAPALAERLTADATGGDALPLLAFTIEHLYREFAPAGSLTLEQYESIGGTSGAIEKALGRALAKPADAPAIPAGRDEQLALLRAAFIPWLARVDPDTGERTRRVAQLNELPPASRAVVERLVAARLLTVDRRTGADVVEIAHESLLRQWPELTKWLQDDDDDLKAVEAIERAAGEWARNGRQAGWLTHQTNRLKAAERLLRERPDLTSKLGSIDRAYLVACRKREKTLKTRAAAGVLGVAVIVGLVVLVLARWEDLKLRVDLFSNVLWASAERSLQAKQEFRECSQCPIMVVVAAGKFTMGSAPTGQEHVVDEGPQHGVTVAKPFAVSKYEVTFADWDTCVEHRGCGEVSDNGWGRGDQPVINVDWNDAQQYVAWLSEVTGKTYRLLTEAEYEYVTRAGTQTVYWWGNDIGKNNANCDGCGSKWDNRQTAPVRSFTGNEFVSSFSPNAFGFYDLVGNVWEWTEDCYHDSYDGAPADGSAWTSGKCDRRVLRGGSWSYYPGALRAAGRNGSSPDDRVNDLGFRIARTLLNP